MRRPVELAGHAALRAGHRAAPTTGTGGTLAGTRSADCRRRSTPRPSPRGSRALCGRDCRRSWPRRVRPPNLRGLADLAGLCVASDVGAKSRAVHRAAVNRALRRWTAQARHTPTLQLQLFGAPEIRLAGVPYPGLAAKTQALLFYLGMTRQDRRLAHSALGRRRSGLTCRSGMRAATCARRSGAIAGAVRRLTSLVDHHSARLAGRTRRPGWMAVEFLSGSRRHG